MKKIDVSFISINYNSSEYTIDLLKSIEKYTSLSYEIIIVDNASELADFNQLKDYIEQVDNCKLVRNRMNAGFASGNMQGTNYASGEYYFFINNDTKLLNDCSLIMKKYLDKNLEIALSTAKVNDENGNFSSSYKLFPSLTKELLGNSIARKFNKNKFPSNKIVLKEPTLVEVVSGSCMFFRTATFCEIGGFDTIFFLYCEEEDISKRVWDNGNKVVFLPDAEIFHASGGSTTKSFEVLREYDISYAHLISKHFSLFTKIILRLLRLFKLFRRSFRTKDSLKLFLFALKGFNNKYSLRYYQKLVSI